MADEFASIVILEKDMNVKIQGPHASYIMGESKFPKYLRDRLCQDFISKKKDFTIISLSECEMDEVREIAMDLFMENGLDDNQEPTDIGRILEDLIDLFYVK
ncbi:MAG: hypothetical protein AUJ51_12895 [Elusimicrobia bacterium CG1_02_56_21]|nr:MAG: hypothetical protein AUJ51_12895 [Elusimicrobia bacterium CG1_02_56_21]